MPNPVREPRLGSFVTWLVLIGSFGLSASTWIAIAELAGWTDSWTINDVTIKLAWLMPTVVDGYLVAALVLWMAPVPAHIAAFARKHTYGSAFIGIAAQAAYHALIIWSTTGVLWRAVMACVAGSLPPAFAAFAVHMRALVRREGRNQTAPVPPLIFREPDAPAPRIERGQQSMVLAVPAQRPEPVMPGMPEAEEPESEELDDPSSAAPAFQEPAVFRTRKYPTSAYPMVRVPAPTPEVPDEEIPVGGRRSREETRRMALEIMANNPGIQQTEVAKRMNITTRWLREVMNEDLAA